MKKNMYLKYFSYNVEIELCFTETSVLKIIELTVQFL